MFTKNGAHNKIFEKTHTYKLARIVVTHLLIADVKFPDHILLMDILRLQSDLQLAELNILIFLQWPVLVALLLSFLHSVAQHHNSSALKLPHHLPQVIHCALEWSLSDYVSVPLLVAL